MGETEYKIFVFLATLILLVFIGGIIVFILQYHKRKLLHEKEKAVINVLHTQDLLNTKLEIQQQTMHDISREIHDNILQRLGLASILANQLSHENLYPLATDRIAAIANTLNESLGELRGISRSLQNNNSDTSELEDLVKNECNRVNDLNLCKVAFTYNETTFHISSTIKTFILRIIQEFMQNSLKHANCKNISINFQYEESGIRINVMDDGIGFDKSGYEQKGGEGIGLTNMKKRAELIGADFDLNSELNKGTYLTIFIPENKLKIT